MPQKPNYAGYPDQPDITSKGPQDFSGYPDQPGQQEEPSGMDWWIDQGLRTVPAVAGSIVGGIFGNVPGAMVGGGLGSGAGNIMANLYSGRDINPWEVGVETGLGAVPPIFRPIKAAGMGARELVKYVAKQGGVNAAEGALVSAGATPFQEWAETGNIIPSRERVTSSVLGGAAFGTVLGGGFGLHEGMSHQNPDAYYRPPVPRESAPPPSIPMGPTPTMEDMAPRSPAMPPPDFTIPSPPSQIPEPVRGVGGPANLPIETSATNRFIPAGFDIVNVTNPSAGLNEQLRSEGFTPWIDHRGPNGEAQMIRRTPTESPTKSNWTKNEVIFNEEDGFVIPKSDVTKADIDSLKNQGFTHSLTEEGDSYFVREDLNGPAFQRVDPNESYDDIASQATRPSRTGGLKIKVDIPRAATNITRDYTSPLSGIMVREGLQNALDAADKLGTGGHVRVRVRDNPGIIEIHDNGSGLDATMLDEKLATLFATGKEGEAGATGGKGIGSASYMLGGEHFEIDTVAIDSIDGNKYRIVASGTPAELLDQVKGSNWVETPVPKNTPTGTTIKVKLLADQQTYNSRGMVNNIIQNTRNRPSKVTVDEYGNSNKPISEISPADFYSDEHTFKSTTNDKVVGDFTVKNNDVKVLVPPHDATVERSSIQVHYLNNGMYQFTETMHIDGKVAGVPDNVLIDIRPLVDDTHPDYPFINTREDMKKEFKDIVDEYVKKNITGPAVEKKKNRVQELYDSMPQIQEPGLARNSVVFDPGQRLTPKEMESFSNDPIIKNLVKHYDELINNIIQSTGRIKWAERLEGIGIVLDPSMHGVHIPNPATDKSTILINPFIRAEMGASPKINAFENTITNLHEVAHIGTEHGTPINLNPADLADPRVGEFLASYMNQVVSHGDIGWKNTGHGMGFAHRLGEVYAGFGVRNTFAAADQLEQIFTGGSKTGRYSPEFQKLLQLYQESRGRAATTEDLLSGTGVKQSNQGSTGTGGIPGNNQANGNGIPPSPTTSSTSVGGGGKKPSTLQEIYNLARGVTTTLDLSAALRQGIGMITRKEWWKSWNQMISALGSEGAYQKTLADLKNRPMFQSKWNPQTKKYEQSFASRVGLKLMDVSSNLNRREEAVASNWVETGGMFGSDNIVQRGYQKTLGKAARASNRAYTAFLNQLRADSFESLMKDAERDFNSGTKGAKNPYTDLMFARELADFVNTATGRGPLKLALPNVEGGKVGLKERSLEQNIGLFTNTIFSPRLMASRVRMLNPATYMMASPYVRKQYVKSMLGVAGAWGTVAALGKMAGAEVSTDTNSADFGKIKVGNTRLDAAGGFQQYLVAASRLLSGHTTSSATQRDFELGQGYRPETRMSTIERFGSNKLHPVMKFGYDLLNASTHQPFSVGDRTAQMFVPLIVGDILDLAKEDPSLIPWMGPLVGAGMGTQTYDKGSSQNKYIPKEMDYTFTGGELPLMPQIVEEDQE